MAPDTDPYRTLGLPRGAPVADVRKAYRRLAKANHPDSAGEAALPQFLAIQAAYDQIVGAGAPGRAGGRGRPPGRPWDADPDRAEATRRAYGGRSQRGRTGGQRGGGTPGHDPGADPGPRRGRRPNRADGPDRKDGPDRPGLPPNKATLGSTSYDGTEGEPFEPGWGGASWYGTTSGTYWTLNPKEYADPRKHGPEYLARARRASEGARIAPESAPESAPGSAPGHRRRSQRPSQRRRTRRVRGGRPPQGRPQIRSPARTAQGRPRIRSPAPAQTRGRLIARGTRGSGGVSPPGSVAR